MRRIAAVVAAIAIPVLLVAGCRAAQPAGAGHVTAPSTTTPDKSARTPTSPGSTAAPPAIETPPVEPSGYPTDYHRAVLAAWSSHDTARLALLTSDPDNFLAIPGHPDQNWTPVQCGGPVGSEYCGYENRDGDAITIRVGRQAFTEHKWHVANLHRWDPITFPADPKAYADEFLHAWIDGYHTRMLMLSLPQVVDHFNALGLIDDSYTITTKDTASHTHVRITRAGGFNQTIAIRNQQVALRLPHAIDGFA